jgi:hemolysin activation/secretion protein
MGRERVRGAIWGGLTSLAMSAAAGVAAADAPPQAPGAPPPSATAPLSSTQLNPAAQAAPATRRRLGDMFSAPAPEDCALPADPALRFTLRGVRVEGAAGLTAAAVGEAWSRFKDRTIVPADICKVRDALAQRLFRQGIFARVIIPEQHVGPDGVVALKVVEARIQTVRFHGEIGPVQAKVEAILNHLRGLTPFNLDTAQRYLLLANEVPGVSAAARLSRSNAPGAGPGDLDVDVDLSLDRYQVLGDVQNTSAKSLGPWSAIARVDLNSLTPLGERTSLVGYTTLGNNTQEVVQIIEQVHIGSNGVYAQAGFAYGHSKPGDILAPLDLVGDSYVGTLEVDDPVIRLKRLSLTLSAGLDLVNQTETLGGQRLDNDVLRIVWLRARAYGRHEFAEPVLGDYLTASADVQVDLRQGLHALGASATGAADLSRPHGVSDAFVAREDGAFALRFDPPGRGAAVTLSVHSQAQWADRPLLAYEQMPVGNLTIGRGYDPSAATGDRLLAAEFKAEVGPFAIGQGVRIGPYGFYDIARTDNLGAGTPNVTLRSVGGGLEILLPYHLHADLAYAEPLDRIAPFATSRPPGRLLFQLLVQY